MLNLNEIPSWLINLELEDINFIKKFILYSGSLKDLAKDYDITYPTMRIRLDKLIEKIKILALDNKIDLDTAKSLINEYRKVRKKYDNR